MKLMLGMFLAAGVSLAAASAAQAAPFPTAAARAGLAAEELNRTLTAPVGYYRRGHYRPVRIHRHVRYRPVHYRPVYHRPAYYRPFRHRPAFHGGFHPAYVYGPRCVVRYRPVYTWAGWVHQPVRICRW